MSEPQFVLKPGTWCGDGKISLNMVEEDLIFFTTWNVLEKDLTGKIQSVQSIQIQGLSENMRNELLFYDFSEGKFSVEMRNDNVGRIVGTGVYNEHLIAWEFRENDLNFEGYETYHFQPDGSYHMKGEYISSDQFRTLIEGRIWLQSNETPDQISFEEEEDEEEE